MSLCERVLVWFSCGAASAVAAKLASEKYGKELEVLYCDTLAYEHSDNKRFMADVEKWIGRKIKILRSEKYKDIYEVFATGYLVGVAGAMCTRELKKKVRIKYQRPDDLHIFGLTHDEKKRIANFNERNSDLDVEWILDENKITKSNCYAWLNNAGIEIPTMYKLGFNNNNCIGCVKAANMKYWERTKKHFPHIYKKMAGVERKLDVAINKRYINGKRVRLFLDELTQEDFDRGRNVPEPDIECGALCVRPSEQQSELFDR